MQLMLANELYSDEVYSVCLYDDCLMTCYFYLLMTLFCWPIISVCRYSDGRGWLTFCYSAQATFWCIWWRSDIRYDWHSIWYIILMEIIPYPRVPVTDTFIVVVGITFVLPVYFDLWPILDYIRWWPGDAGCLMCMVSRHFLTAFSWCCCDIYWPVFCCLILWYDAVILFYSICYCSFHFIHCADSEATLFYWRNFSIIDPDTFILMLPLWYSFG